MMRKQWLILASVVALSGIVYFTHRRIERGEFESIRKTGVEHLARFNNGGSIDELVIANGLLRKAENMGFGDASLYHNLGVCADLSGNASSALEYYLKSLEEKPDRKMTLFHAGRCFSELGNAEKALDFFNRIEADLSEPFSSLFFEMAYAYSGLGKFDKAVEYYDKELNDWPDNHSARRNLGTIFLSSGDYERALSLYEQIPESAGEAYIAALFNSSAIKCQQEKWEESVELMKKVPRDNQRGKAFAISGAGTTYSTHNFWESAQFKIGQLYFLRLKTPSKAIPYFESIPEGSMFYDAAQESIKLIKNQQG